MENETNITNATIRTTLICEHCHREISGLCIKSNILLDDDTLNVKDEDKRVIFFCSKKCYQNWNYHNRPAQKERVRKNAIKSHMKMSLNPELILRNRKKTREWIETHKEHHNALMRVYMREKWRKDHPNCVRRIKD